MKICANCQFSKPEALVAGGQAQMVLVCTHEECRDPVDGSMIPCLPARQQIVWCGFPARYYKEKEAVEPKKEEGQSNLIQLK